MRQSKAFRFAAGPASSGNTAYPGFRFFGIRKKPLIRTAVKRFVFLDFRSILVAMRHSDAPYITLAGNHELFGLLFEHRHVTYFPTVIRQGQRHDGAKILVRFQVQGCEAMHVHEYPERAPSSILSSAS